MDQVNKAKWGLTGALGAALLVALVMMLSIPANPSRAQGTQPTRADDPGRAVVAVEFSDGTRSARSITWTTAISRVVALELAGFEVEHVGDSVCRIEGDGCPAADCFCADNWWWQGRWLAGVWDGSEFPPPNLEDGDVVAFHNKPLDWSPPKIGALSYVAVASALEWLRPQQSLDDGSYSGPFGNVGPTTDMALAVAANGEDPGQWRRAPGSPSLIDYVTVASAVEYANRSAASAGKLALTLAAAHVRADGGQGTCYPALGKKPAAYYHPDNGAYYSGADHQAGIQSWAMLGVAALGETVPISAVQALTAMANPDGGWAYHSAFGGSDTMATAQSIQALVAAGAPANAPAIQNGLVYLKGNQNPDGGFAYSSPGDSDVSATAYAIQAIIAAGEDPITGTWKTVSGTIVTNPINYLNGVQLPDASFPAYSPLLATQQAIPGLLQQPFPLAVAQVPDCRTWPIWLPMMSRGSAGK